jgi:O-antigen/teichoic acid export membrane protein
MTILMPPVQFFQAVNTMLIPFCAGRGRTRVAQLVTTAGASETLVAIAYSVLTWFFSRPLLHSLYDGKYDLYAPYLLPLSLLLLGEAFAGVMSSALRALELPKKVFAGCFAGALLTGIGIVCLRSFEMREAVWLIVVVYAATAAMLGVSLSRVLGGRGVAWLKAGEEPCA